MTQADASHRNLGASARPSAGATGDPAALVVRHQHGDDVYATVFGQLIESHPGDLRLEYSREPWTAVDWTTMHRRGDGD